MVVAAACGQEAMSGDPYRCFTSVLQQGTTTEREGLGALNGVRYGAKDNLDTVAFPTTANTPALAGRNRLRDNPVIARLARAGAVLVGKTNMHELALGVSTTAALFPATVNPAVPSHSAGGSSGGSAAAVASGYVPFALATDTGGSVSIPAAWCGVLGFRPSTGRWPSGGVVPLSHTRDTVGVIARTFDLLLEVDAAVTGASDTGRMSEPDSSTTRIGIPSPESVAVRELSSEVHAMWQRSIESLGEAEAVELVEVDLDHVYAGEMGCGPTIERYEIFHDLSAYLAQFQPALRFEEVLEAARSDSVKRVLTESMDFRDSTMEYRRAMDGRQMLRSSYEAVLITAGVRGVLYPTTPMSAPRLDAAGALLDTTEARLFEHATRHVNPGSVAGHPTVTFPGGVSPRGLPVGLSIDGRRGDDRGLIEIARQMDTILRQV